MVCKGSKSPGVGGVGRIGRGWAGEVVVRKVAPRKIKCLARGAKLIVVVCCERVVFLRFAYYKRIDVCAFVANAA